MIPNAIKRIAMVRLKASKSNGRDIDKQVKPYITLLWVLKVLPLKWTINKL